MTFNRFSAPSLIANSSSELIYIDYDKTISNLFQTNIQSVTQHLAIVRPVPNTIGGDQEMGDIQHQISEGDEQVVESLYEEPREGDTVDLVSKIETYAMRLCNLLAMDSELFVILLINFMRDKLSSTVASCKSTHALDRLLPTRQIFRQEVVLVYHLPSQLRPLTGIKTSNTMHQLAGGVALSGVY